MEKKYKFYWSKKTFICCLL